MEDWGMDHWAYYYNEGVNLKEAGDKEASAQFFLKALKMEPELEMPEAWHNAGAALLSLGKKDEAQPYLEKAISLYDLIINSIREADELENQYEADQLINSDEDPDSYQDDPKEFLNQEEGDEDEDEDEGDDELHFDDEDDEILIDEPIAAYLYWKACCYALLGNKSLMLMTLEESITEDDWYAIEALEEEELLTFREDPAFRQLIDPVVARINAPDHAHLFDIFERIEAKILIGFEDPNGFVEEVVEKVNAERWPDETPVTWIRKTARDLHRKRLELSKTWSHPTDVDRLAAAFDGLVEKGIAALHNVSPDDFDSVDEIISELKILSSTPGAIRGVCFYEEEDVMRLIHQQGGPLFITFRSTQHNVDHDQLTTGKKIIEALKEQGFSPEWDERAESRIVIPAFWWNKVYVSDDEQERWDPWRLFDKF